MDPSSVSYKFRKEIMIKINYVLILMGAQMQLASDFWNFFRKPMM